MIKRAWKTIGVQLALWYTAIFALSSVAIFAVAVLLLQTYLSGQDKDFIHGTVEKYQSRFDDDGFDAMMSEIREDLRAPGMGAVLIRVASRDNQTLFSDGERLSEYDVASLDRQAPRENKWTRVVQRGDEDQLDIFTVRLRDGKILQVGKTTVQRNAPVERFVSIAAGVLVPVIAMGLLGGVALSARILRPLRSLISTVQAVTTTGRLGARVPVRGTRDELDELGLLFNRMLDRIELVVDGMKNALDNVAHDLRTPMTRLRNTAESALQPGGRPGAQEEALADCLEQSDEALTMLKTLMDVSEAETGTLKLNRESLKVQDVVDGVLDLYGAVAEEKGVALEGACDAALLLNADRARLKQALANLIDNALKYTPPGGRVAVSAARVGAMVTIAVRDNGPGIPEGELPRIWDRLYRGNTAHGTPGLGLGLSLVQAIVRAHGGDVAVASRPANGSVFTLSLPSS